MQSHSTTYATSMSPVVAAHLIRSLKITMGYEGNIGGKESMETSAPKNSPRLPVNIPPFQVYPCVS